MSIVFLGGGCFSKSFEHGDGPSEFDSESFGGVGVSVVGGSGFFGDGVGNYPHPATTRCGDVLGELPAIEQLESAWAVISVPGATADGEPFPTGSVVLRLSETPMHECGAAPGDGGPFDFGGSTGSSGSSGDASGTGASLPQGPRGLELTLNADEFGKGTHTVTTLDNPRVWAYGTGATLEVPPTASIELQRVDDDCVIGTIRGFEATDGTPFMHGGFVAQTCQRQCIPTPNNPC